MFSQGSSSNKRYRGSGGAMGVTNTNFYEVEGQARTNPALELNEADYDAVLEVILLLVAM